MRMLEKQNEVATTSLLQQRQAIQWTSENNSQ